MINTPKAESQPALGGLEAASRAFDDAQYRKDVAALERMLAADLTYIRGSGEIAGREAFIATFSDPAVRFEPFEISNRKVVALAKTVAAVTAEGRITGTDGGVPFTDHFRFTDTFAWRNGEWKVVFVQVTRLPA